MFFQSKISLKFIPVGFFEDLKQINIMIPAIEGQVALDNFLHLKFGNQK